jgi:hypothetical protein
VVAGKAGVEERVKEQVEKEVSAGVEEKVSGMGRTKEVKDVNDDVRV